ncbi:hypothetical protein AB0H73_09850 [Streptomyces olivoreticuli]
MTTLLPAVDCVAEAAREHLLRLEGDVEYWRLRTAVLTALTAGTTFTGFPVISHWDAARDGGPLFEEALRALALRAAVLERTSDPIAALLPLAVPVDAMVHVVLAQGPLAWRVAEGTGVSLVHQGDQENVAYVNGCYTCACYRQAWGEPPGRYWLDQAESARRQDHLGACYESIGLARDGRAHRIDFTANTSSSSRPQALSGEGHAGLAPHGAST